MTEPTGVQRLATYHAIADRTDVAQLKRVASAYRPENDAEVERLRALGDKLPAPQRVAIGYHDKAKAAHNALKNLEQ